MKGWSAYTFGSGKGLTVVCVYAPNDSLLYPIFLESLGLVLETTPPTDSIVLLGEFNTPVIISHGPQLEKGGLPTSV